MITATLLHFAQYIIIIIKRKRESLYLLLSRC